MTVHYPHGMQIGFALNEIDEPLVALRFQCGDPTSDGDDVEEMVVTESELSACIGLCIEAQVRAGVLREMLTMFPDQKDTILANVFFRWMGTIDGG